MPYLSVQDSVAVGFLSLLNTFMVGCTWKTFPWNWKSMWILPEKLHASWSRQEFGALLPVPSWKIHMDFQSWCNVFHVYVSMGTSPKTSELALRVCSVWSHSKKSQFLSLSLSVCVFKHDQLASVWHTDLGRVGKLVLESNIMAMPTDIWFENDDDHA